MSNLSWKRRRFLKWLAASPGILLVGCNSATGPEGKSSPGAGEGGGPLWGFAVDTERCIGCCACMRGCRAENDVPEGMFRTWIERYQVTGEGKVHVDAPQEPGAEFLERPDPEVVKAFFVPKLCNHCSKAVCSQVCPVGASYKTQDGVLLVDPELCIGCGYCVQACPYGVRFVREEKGIADKCTLCYHRIKRGGRPVCVQACPKQARIFGDLTDPESRISTILRQRRHHLLRPEMGTHPKCYYLGLDDEVI